MFYIKEIVNFCKDNVCIDENGSADGILQPVLALQNFIQLIADGFTI